MKSPFGRHAQAMGLTAALTLGALVSTASAQNRLNSEALSVSPVPNARYVPRETTILIRSQEALDPVTPDAGRLFQVEGSKSGTHSGRVAVSDDPHAIVFQPSTPFEYGETVRVSVREGLWSTSGKRVSPEPFAFQISAHPPRLGPSSQELTAREWGLESFPAAPLGTAAVDSSPPGYPTIQTTLSGTPGAGRIFVSNFKFTASGYTPYLLILSNDGSPYFYRQMSASCQDFKPQPNGLLTYYHSGTSRFYAMDSTYAIVDSFLCGNGYSTDVHELRILPNGHALLMSYDQQFVDMRQYVAGGDSTAAVVGLIIQELDTHKNVVFQWRSWDYFNIMDAHGVNFTSYYIDCVHGNAMDVDTDGNILLSSRHLEEITKIDRTTGALIWRMGGNHNQFTFLNDPIGFSYQHAIRRIPNGHITLFDNGNMHAPQVSRAVEYQLDEVNKTATLVWQYHHSPELFGVAMGYVQRLSNGNTLIGWGATNPSITEVDSANHVVFELNMDPGVFSYRALRVAWHPGTTVAVSPQLGGPARFLSVSPNPIRRAGSVSFQLSRAAAVQLSLFDATGRRRESLIRGALLSAGRHDIRLDASGLPSGMYFCKLSAGGATTTARVVLVR